MHRRCTTHDTCSIVMLYRTVKSETISTFRAYSVKKILSRLFIGCAFSRPAFPLTYLFTFILYIINSARIYSRREIISPHFLLSARIGAHSSSVVVECGSFVLLWFVEGIFESVHRSECVCEVTLRTEN